MDVWATKPTREVYTQYTRQDATRIERICITRNISGRKRGVETVETTMTKHLAVVLRIVWEGPVIRRSRGYCKMNVALLKEKLFREEIRKVWLRWTKNK